jgi:hypothetical protein
LKKIGNGALAVLISPYTGLNKLYNYYKYNREKDGERVHVSNNTNGLARVYYTLAIPALGIFLYNSVPQIKHGYHSLIDAIKSRGTEQVAQPQYVPTPNIMTAKDSSDNAIAYLQSGAACRDTLLSELLHKDRKANELCYFGLHPAPAKPAAVVHEQENQNSEAGASVPSGRRKRSGVNLEEMMNKKAEEAAAKAANPNSKGANSDSTNQDK